MTVAPTNPTRRLSGLQLFASLAVFGGALALRLLFIAQTETLPEYLMPTPGLDADLYWNAAREIRSLDSDRPRLALRMASGPAYAFYLAGLQATLGADLRAHRIYQAVVGGIFTAAIYLVALRVSGDPWAALVSGVLAAALPSLIYFQTWILKPAFELPLLLAAMAMVLPQRTRPVSAGYALGAGALLGILCCSQRSALLFLPLFAWTIASAGPASLRVGLRTGLLRINLRTALLFAVAALFIASVYRLPYIGDDRISLPLAGVHARIGFHPGATGAYHALDGVPPSPHGHAFVARMRTEAREHRRLTPGEADRIHLSDAVRYATTEPGSTLLLLLRKAQLFFNDFEPKGNQSYYLIRQQAPFLQWIPLGYGALVVLGTLGALSLWRSGQRRAASFLFGCILTVLVAVLLTFVTWRYRLHAVVPLLLLGGVGGVDAIRSGVATARGALSPVTLTKRTFAPAAIAVLVAFSPVGLRDDLRGATANARRSQQAMVMLERLRNFHQGSATGNPSLRARLLGRLHRHSQAMALLERHAHQPPGLSARSYAQLLTYWGWLGDHAAALRLLDEVVANGTASRADVLAAAPPYVRDWVALREAGGRLGKGG